MNDQIAAERPAPDLNGAIDALGASALEWKRRALAAETALRAAIRIADEAREEWDKAPSDMRAGKILIALSGGCPGYRSDIDAVHAALNTDHTA